MTNIERQLQSMAVGECRWIEREDIHAYCFGTWSRSRYDAAVKSYKVVTARRDFDGQAWVSAEEAARVISRLSSQGAKK